MTPRLPTALRALSLTLALLLANAGTAVAGTAWFVAPGGNNTSCAIQLPCSIAQAVAKAAAGDEIVLQPGAYTQSELGPELLAIVKSGVSMHGVLGAPRPVITLTNNLGFGGSPLSVNNGGSLSHVEIDSTVVKEELGIDGGTGDDLIVHASAANSVACAMTEGVLRNSACLNSGQGGLALGSNRGSLGPRLADSVQLRNVTALASGSQSVGMAFGFTGIAGVPANLNVRTINAVGLIIRGTENDIVGRSISPEPHNAGSGSVMNLTLSNSDYRNVSTSIDVPSAGGSVTVTQPGTGTNITKEPVLAADSIHQLPSSPTIDAGATDALSGTSALDEVPRKLGKGPDIGAEEFAGATLTAISCDLPSISVAAVTRCVATVADEFPSVAPGGELRFQSSGPGSFDHSSCKVELLLELHELGCRITYNPSGVRPGTHVLTATYPGDGAHTPSSGSTQVRVVASDPNAPETILKTKPKRQTPSRSARFTFVSSPPGAKFQCKVDKKPFKPCHAPFRIRVGAGRHLFEVRAVNGGSVDPTPAAFRWKVQRK